MNICDMFKGEELPVLLSEDKLFEHLMQFKNGNLKARNVIINHNLRLVVYIAKKYINLCDGGIVEFDDLMMAGMLGLVKGVDTYDISRKVKLSTYVSKCINNEILMYLRKCRKIVTGVSLDDEFNINDDCKGLKLMDTICDTKDSYREIIRNVEYLRIRELVDDLEYMDKRIIEMSFGFIDDKIYTQKEIANEFGLSQAYISRKVRMITKCLKKKLEKEDIFY